MDGARDPSYRAHLTLHGLVGPVGAPAGVVDPAGDVEVLAQVEHDGVHDEGVEVVVVLGVPGVRVDVVAGRVVVLPRTVGMSRSAGDDQVPLPASRDEYVLLNGIKVTSILWCVFLPRAAFRK